MLVRTILSRRDSSRKQKSKTISVFFFKKKKLLVFSTKYKKNVTFFHESVILPFWKMKKKRRFPKCRRPEKSSAVAQNIRNAEYNNGGVEEQKTRREKNVVRHSTRHQVISFWLISARGRRYFFVHIFFLYIFLSNFHSKFSVIGHNNIISSNEIKCEKILHDI